MSNEYEPWVELGISELEYWKRLYIESVKRENLLQKGCEALADFNCACECGTQYSPEFICGPHKYMLGLFKELDLE